MRLAHAQHPHLDVVHARNSHLHRTQCLLAYNAMLLPKRNLQAATITVPLYSHDASSSDFKLGVVHQAGAQRRFLRHRTKFHSWMLKAFRSVGGDGITFHSRRRCRYAKKRLAKMSL
mgnify:CR=1 FL=1